MPTSQLLIARIHEYIATNDIIPHGSTVIIGLSGGPDSVFLLHLLVQMQTSHKVQLIATHLNHGWRPEAEDDANFCRALAQRLGIAYEQAHLHDFKDVIRVQKTTNEALGRCVRRYFFEQCARKYGADRIALAHHADDQEETFFMRIIRGTTLSGLTGMRPQHGLYVRPLLQTYKRDILAYLHHYGIAYRLDATNAHMHYLRNNIRQTVLPALKASDSRFERNFERMMRSLQETERFLDTCTLQVFQQIVDDDLSHGTGIAIASLLAHDPVVRDRVIMHWLHHHRVPYLPQERFIHEIVRFLTHSRGGTHRLHARWHILKKRTKAYIQLIP